MKRFVVAFAAILAGTAYGALPTPIIDLGFNEGAGTVAANSGSAGGTLTLSTPVPTWSTNVPPGVGGASSVDFATTTGNYFIESPANYAELTGLTKFTVTGWANCRNSTEGSGGNRLVTWINHGGQGVDVVYKSDGSVQVGINQWPDGVPARSSAGKITTDAGAGAGNWCFFAVTYDSTLSSGHVKFYFGRTPGDAAFDVERNYARGAVGTNISRLCIGHFNVATRAGAQNRMFRGLIDEVKVFGEALTLEQIRAVQIGNPEIAGGADPAGSAQDVPTDVVLSWQPGQFARTHDVYFGTSLADVETASRQSPKGVLVSQGQSSTAYDPAGLLAFGQTYYWRIDEVNAPPSNTIFKGNVWSFTTEPYAYPIASVTATASSSDKASTGPEKTVNGSGLTNDLHSTVGEAMWLSSMAGAQPAWIQYRFDRVYKLYELWVWNHNTEYEPLLGFGFKDVAIEYSLDGTTWTLLKETQFAKAPAANGYAHNTAVDLGGVTAQHVRLIARSNWSTVGLKQYGLSEVRFFHVPIAARAPQPANGAAGLALDTVLSWRPGRDVVSHRVYFGTDKAAVTDGTVAAVTATERRYTPAALALDTTYFWRVDEVGTAGTYPGDVWNFSTAKFLVVDDFETYTDAEGSRIYEAWVDGYGTTTNGAQVGNLQAPFAERTIIQGGKQAMPLTYDNAAGKISETTRTFEAAQDWTAHGVKSLSLWFYGDPANAGQLYVKIDNTKVLYNGEAVDLKRRQWQPWNIDLAAVGGVSKVTKLTIGIEGA
ncbi:MAG: hypothetical protein FJ280_21580, partial [Planctomycetes bacterium]|nr:hypothetical protein [Planctomycetota bacterium]